MGVWVGGCVCVGWGGGGGGVASFLFELGGGGLGSQVPF